MATSKGFRILALPISRASRNGRPAFVYYHVQSPPEPVSKNPHFLKRAMDKAATTWAAMGEKEKSSWQYKLYDWGERVADRVEFEETALKSVNASFATTPGEEAKLAIPFISPSGLHAPLDAWKTLMQSREPYHRKYFYLWLLGLPITAPIGIAPIIPNIPFYFCAWRSWSHWKAWRVSTRLNELLKDGSFTPTVDPKLDSIYRSSIEAFKLPPSISDLSIVDPLPEDVESSQKAPQPDASGKTDPQVEKYIVLHSSVVPQIVSSYELQPSVGADILRAIEQVRQRLKKEIKGET